MIEAMACGTPVIAWRCGSVPEVDRRRRDRLHRRFGDEAVDAVAGVLQLDRRVIRAVFERRFSADEWPRDYVDALSA